MIIMKTCAVKCNALFKFVCLPVLQSLESAGMHDYLLSSRIKHSFGIRGTALN